MISFLTNFFSCHQCGLAISVLLCLQLVILTRTTSSVILDGNIEIVHNDTSTPFLLRSPESSLKIRVRYPPQSMSPWEILLLSVVLGAVAMRCAMVDDWLSKINAFVITEASSVDKSWISNEATVPAKSEYETKITQTESFDDVNDDSDTESLQNMENHEVTQEPTPSEEHIEHHSEAHGAISHSPKQEPLIDEDSDELIDSIEPVALYQIEGSSKRTKIEIRNKRNCISEGRKLVPKMWGLSYSLDDVMRPIHAAFAPQTRYQTVDSDLYRSTTQEHALFDNEDLLKSLDLVLGRFATRQNNLNLLKKVYNWFSWPDQQELWQCLRVAIQYKSLDCFKFLISHVDGETNRSRILDLCAYHNQIDMLKEAFATWIESEKTDTANVPLVVAATYGRLGSVRYLLTKCTKIEVQATSPFIDARYTTSVMAASAHGHLGVLRELVAAGARLRREGLTAEEATDPFVKAISTENATMLECLLTCKYSIFDGRNQYLHTILELAVRKNNLKLTRWALEQDEVTRSTQYESSFLMACQQGDLELIHEFIECYVPHTILESIVTNSQHHHAPGTRLLLNPYERHKLIIDLVNSHCLHVYQLLLPRSLSMVSQLAWLGDVRGLTLLLRREPQMDLNKGDSKENSPLFHAMYNHMRRRNDEIRGHAHRWLSTVSLLLAHGARLNLLDGSYWATHHGGVPKALLADLRQLPRMLKVDGSDFI